LGQFKPSKSNLTGVIEDTAWVSQETKTKDGLVAPKGTIKLAFDKSLGFTFEITGAKPAKGKIELKQQDSVMLHFEEEFNGRKDHEEQITIVKDVLTLTDTDGTVLKFDRVAGMAKQPKSDSNLAGRIEGTKWSSQTTMTADGVKLPPGIITLELNRDKTFIYKAGKMTWTGKYELLKGDGVKLISEQDLGGRRENVETIIINDNILTMIDTDGSKVVFDAVMAPAVPKGKAVSNLKGKIEGTRWRCLKSVINGIDIEAGSISINFKSNLTFEYKAGPMTWTGRYVLLEGDGLKLLSDQELGGTKENFEKIIIEKDMMTMTDPSGTQLKFSKAPSDD
jgi:hypothetical protein